MSPINQYKRQLGIWLEREPDEVFLFWKARVAFYAILKAMDVGAGDEVILPAYTCVVVPNAVLYLGATPIYVDIDPDTYNLDVSKLEDAITEKTKVIVCQNTYGLAPDLNAITAIARQRGIYTVEDSAHGMGGRYQGKPNGLMTDAAFFSTQWNKAFSTGIGGFAVANSPEIKTELKRLESEATTPSFLNVTNLQLLYWVRQYLVIDFTYYSFVGVYRFLSKHNLVIGSSNGEEITSIQQPAGYFKSFSWVQARKGIKTLLKLDDILENRKQAASEYSKLLASYGKKIQDTREHEHSYLQYPVLVSNRSEFVKLAVSERVPVGDWFNSPLHPVQENLASWGLDRANFPVSDYVSKHVVNLSTELSKVPRTLEFIKTNIDRII